MRGRVKGSMMCRVDICSCNIGISTIHGGHARMSWKPWMAENDDPPPPPKKQKITLGWPFLISVCHCELREAIYFILFNGLWIAALLTLIAKTAL
jgi:hypothetical protein